MVTGSGELVRPFTQSSNKPDRQKLAGQVSGSEIPDAVRLNAAW